MTLAPVCFTGRTVHTGKSRILVHPSRGTIPGKDAGSYDMWSVGVTLLELVLGKPHVFVVPPELLKEHADLLSNDSIAYSLATGTLSLLGAIQLLTEIQPPTILAILGTDEVERGTDGSTTAIDQTRDENIQLSTRCEEYLQKENELLRMGQGYLA